MMSGPSKADLRLARKLGTMIPALQLQDLVTAVLPDGSEILIKGRDHLSAVIASGEARVSNKTALKLPTVEMAAALEGLLGNDGAFTALRQMGHA